MVNQDRLVNEFLQLIKLDSVTFHERAVAEYVKARLFELGLEVTEDDAGTKLNSECGNIIAKKSGTRPDLPTILLSSHLDTIEPTAGIKPIIEDGIIRTDEKTILGSDDRAGIAIILEVLRILNEEQIGHGDLEIILTVAEEGGLNGVKQLDWSQINAKIGFVLDDGGEPIGFACAKGPSQDRIEAFIRGKAAHAGFDPEKGINAIQVAGQALAAMKLGRIDFETTANIGRIEGGKATNIVPDMVHLRGEARSHNETKLQQQSAHMRQVIEDAANAAGAFAKVEIKRLYSAYDIDQQHQAVRMVAEAAERLGIKAGTVATGGGCDGNYFNEKGITTLNLSIGMNDVHTVNEWIRIADMVQAAELILEIVKE